MDASYQDFTFDRLVLNGPDPTALVDSLLAFRHVPGLRREQRDAQSAWIEVLTDLRSEWRRRQAELAELEKRVLHKDLGAVLPATADLAFRHEGDDFEWVNRVAFSPDGALLATADSGPAAHVRRWADATDLLEVGGDADPDISVLDV